MRRWLKITTGLAGLTALTGAGILGMRRVQANRKWRQIEPALLVPYADDVFDPAVLTDLPAPAQRYLRHAIAEGALLANSARIDMTDRMKPSPRAGFIELTAEELLAPPVGFQWAARFSIGPFPMWVRDHYFQNDGAVWIEPLGLPVQQSTGEDITRSSRHRLAAESVWMPSALLPGPGVTWEEVDDTHARVTLTIDGETIPLTLAIDETGRLQQVTLERYGNVDVPTWRRIPYGFAVEEEATFDGYTVPSRLRGGWWFGTDRYRPDLASTFHVHAIRYR